MFFTDIKLERRIDELKEYRYRDVLHLKDLAAREESGELVNPDAPCDINGWDVMNTGDRWAGRDRYLWLVKDIEIPEEWAGRQAIGIFDFGKTGTGNNSGFESLLYLDGKPYQGVDSNHMEVLFDSALCKKTAQAAFRLWSGLEGGGLPVDQEHRINRADLAWLDEQADDLYYLASMVLGTIRVLPEEDPVRHQLLSALDMAFHCIDWAYPGGKEFYESVGQADELLNEKIDSMEKYSPVTVKCVGHTHIDVAWLWRYKHTREKCARSFSTVLRMMERFPEYYFLQTQPQLYDYIRQDFPEIYEDIKRKASSGEWEVDGGMWVEADCNLTSGESLTRQLLIGTRFFREEFGKEPSYVWLPDVFGYSWALPQILRKSGIPTFMTTKISWNKYNRMPHDTFLWKGMDGSEVLTHFITTPEPGNEPGSWFYTYNGKILPMTVKGVWDAYKDKDLNQELLICYGYGDGGGGVNRDMLEQRRRLDRIPGLPHVETSTAAEYFKNLLNTVKNTDQYVHTWDGELYLEYHRGTYTSHAYNKRMNRRLEFLYRETEWLALMDGLMQGSLKKARQEELTRGWKILLRNQFHDVIPGSSIYEVYEDSREEYGQAEEIALQVKTGFLENAMQTAEGAYTVFNDAGFQRSGLVRLPGVLAKGAKTAGGSRLTVQNGRDCVWVEVQEIPSMGCVTFETMEEASPDNAGGGAKESVFQVEDRSIETPYYLMEINRHGQISRLYDKEWERELLPRGERANVFQMFEDKPLDNDAWDIDIFYQQKMREITELTEFEVTENGRLRLVIHMEWSYMNSRVIQDMVLYGSSRRIDFETRVDYHETHQLMKAAFPVDIRTTYGTYDIQYGNVRRPNHWNTSWDQARFESVAHRWVDLSERGYGVSLLNDCKYGHDIKDNVMRITLLKAATQPDHSQDQGEHEFTYSLLPHGGDFVEGRTVQEAYALNRPLEAVRGRCKLPFESFLSLEGGEAELDAVKRSEDGDCMVIRFHDYSGSRSQVEVKLGIPYRSWTEGDLMERPAGEEFSGEEIRLEVKPYEIKTVLVTV